MNKNGMWTVVILVFAGVVLGTLGTWSVPLGHGISAFWPAFVVQTAGGIWFGGWGVLAAVFFPIFTNALAGVGWSGVLGYIPANLAQGLIPAWAFRYYRVDPAIPGRKGLIFFAIWGALIPAAAGGMLGSVAVILFGHASWREYPLLVMQWAVPNMVVSLLIGAPTMRGLTAVWRDLGVLANGWWVFEEAHNTAYPRRFQDIPIQVKLLLSMCGVGLGPLLILSLLELAQNRGNTATESITPLFLSMSLMALISAVGFLSRETVRPLRELKEQVETLVHYRDGVLTVERGDEIGELGQAFAFLIDDWRRADALLQSRLRITEFASGHSLADLLQNALDELCASSDSPIGFFHFMEPDQRTLSLQAWSTRTLEEFCAVEGKGRHYDLAEAGVWVDCVREGRPVIHNDYASLPPSRRKGLPEGHAPVVREMVFPIIRNQKIVAIIGVGNKATDYTEDDLSFTFRLADLIWDIAERKRAEAALRESEARIKSISNNLTSGMIYQLVLKPDGTRQFTYLSDSVKELYGISPEEGLADATLIYNRVHEDDIERVLKTEERAAKELSTFRIEARIKVPAGQIRWSSIVSIPTLLEDGSIRWDGLEFIITDRKQAEEALRQSEERYRLLFERVPVGLYRTTETGRILDINMAGARMFGYESPDEFVELGTLDLWEDPDERELMLSWLDERGNIDVEMRLRRRDQTVMWVRNRSRVTQNSRGEIMYIEGSLEDITERKQKDAEINANQIEMRRLLQESNQSRRALLRALEDQKLAEDVIRRRLAEMEAVNHVSTTLRTAQTLDEMLPLLLDETLAALESEAGSIWFYQVENDELRIGAARGWYENLRDLPIKPGQGITGTVYSSGKMHISREFVSDPLIGPAFIKHTPANWGGICVPIRTANEVAGVIHVSVPLPREITVEQTKLLHSLAEMAGTAVHRLRLYEETQKDAAELALAYDTTLKGWAGALELRDQETVGHTMRVTEKTLDLARAMCINEDELENIRRGALLHDIGKMGIPDSILLKPGTLNEREWEIMRRHPEYAFNLLNRIEYLRPALSIPYCHHEKWDGTGYPRGLRGEEIPLAARIFAVVDVWDALTSHRPYRPAWSEADAKKYILQQSGKDFDPLIVQSFLKMVE